MMEKLSIPGGTYTSHAFNLKERKCLRKADLQVTEKEKKHPQSLQLVSTQQEEALREMESHMNLGHFEHYPRLLGTKSQLLSSNYHFKFQIIAISFYFSDLKLNFSNCGTFTLEKR